MNILSVSPFWFLLDKDVTCPHALQTSQSRRASDSHSVIQDAHGEIKLQIINVKLSKVI